MRPFASFCDAAHERDLRVILDGVFNHTGRGFWPFHHLLETGGSSPYRRWFHLDDAALDAGRSLVAYPPDGAPAPALGYEAWWGMPALPKLNTDERDHRCASTCSAWPSIGSVFGIDGWRLDVPGEIADESFWQEFRARCRAIRTGMRTWSGRSWRPLPPTGCVATASTP